MGRIRRVARRSIASGMVLLGLAALRSGWAREVQGGSAATAGTVESHLGKGYDELRGDRYQEAVEEFRAALALNPRLAMQARLPLAIALFQMHQYDSARQELEKVRAQAGELPDVLYYIGRVDFSEGHQDAAIRELSRAAAHPPFPDTAYYLGFAYQKKGELAEAEKWLRKAAELAPTDASVQDRLGILYRDEGKKEEAEGAFARAATLRHRELERNQLAVACDEALKTRPLGQARPVCDQLYDPQDYDRLVTLGTLYGQHGDLEDAVKPFARAAELQPASPQAEYNLALAEYGLKRYAEARAALEKVINAWPDLYNLSALLGATLYQLDDESAAFRALSHAHNLNPQDPETAEMLYRMAMKLGEKSLASKHAAEAVEYLRKAAMLHPNDPAPHLRLAEAYASLGRSAQATRERREAERLSAPRADKPN